MTGRERWLAIFNGQKPDDRWPDIGSAIWPQTRELWDSQGVLSKDVDPNELLEADDGSMVCRYAATMVFDPPFERVILSEKDGKYTFVDRDGITKVLTKENYEMILTYDSDQMPTFVDYPVKTLKDWEKLKQERLQPDSPGRFAADYDEVVKELRAEAETKLIRYPSAISGPGTFGPLRELLGIENLSLMFYDDPALIRKILDDLAEFYTAVMARVLRDVPVDVLQFYEDIGSSAGPIISPAVFREFCVPVYRKMIDFFKQFGVKHFLLDSDGSVALLMPEFIDAGLDSLVPTQQTEPNMAPALLRKKFPEMRLIGGIRKTALTEGEKAIDEELKKAWTVAREQLGFMPVLDGSISPDISWPAFKYFTEQNKLYASGEL